MAAVVRPTLERALASGPKPPAVLDRLIADAAIGAVLDHVVATAPRDRDPRAAAALAAVLERAAAELGAREYEPHDDGRQATPIAAVVDQVLELERVVDVPGQQYIRELEADIDPSSRVYCDLDELGNVVRARRWRDAVRGTIGGAP